MNNKQVFPEHIKFIEDTIENRIFLERMLGDAKFIYNSYSYIEIDLKKKVGKHIYFTSGFI